MSQEAKLCSYPEQTPRAVNEIDAHGGACVRMSATQTEQQSDRQELQPWFAVYTRHQQEKLVAGTLSSKGFDTYLPLCESIRQWADRRKRLSLPLFPGYVFLRGVLDRPLDVLITPGVCNIVAHCGRPAPIPDAEVEAVRRATESTGSLQRHEFMNCGDRVRIKSGTLKGIEGFLVRRKSSFRLVLSVSLLGGSASVEVDHRDVERVT